MSGSMRRYLIIGAAATLVLLASFFWINPALPEKTKGIIQGIVGPHTDAPAGSSAGPESSPAFDSEKWFFQFDLEGYPLPNFDTNKLRNYPPHNYKGPGNFAYATFFATRNATMKDPYFLTAQQIVYRLLWDPKMKTAKHPVVVFVAPFVSEEQREYFSAAGAIVRELKLREFEPTSAGIPARLQDMFTKLEMWRQTDFSRIAYLDSDAIPYKNLDAIWDLTHDQQCKKKLLPVEDEKYIASICNYCFAAWPEKDGGQLNAGVMVFKPDHAMFARLARESRAKKGWDESTLEQALIDYAFSKDSPFPSTHLGHEWNGGVDMKAEGQEFNILHAKVWSYNIGNHTWVTGEYNQTWAELKAFYESPEFEKARAQDLELAFKQLDSTSPKKGS